jgi:tetratricopeptide (TPR) repeat protein
LLDDARERLRENDTDAALRAADKALRMPCRDAEGLLVRAAVYRQDGDDDTALADLREALLLHPGYAAAAAAIGWIHFDGGAVDRAAERFAAATAADAACAQAWAGLAAIATARGEPAAAAAMLESRLDRIGDAALVHVGLGEARLAQGDLDAAIAAFAEAKRRDSRSWRAHAGLGMACLRKGDGQAAAKQLRDAVELHAGAHDARCALVELLLADGEYAEAGTILAPALQAHPQLGELHALHGLVERGRGNRAAAIDALERALARGVRQTGRIEALLGVLLLQEQKWEAASAHLARAVDLDETRADAMVSLGIARFRLGDHAGAAVRLAQALALAPSDEFAHYSIAVLYKDYLLQPAKALEHLRAHRRHGGARARVDEWIKQLER